MTRREWTAIAEALGDLRRKVAASWPPKGGYNAFEAGVYDRRLIRDAQLDAIDQAAREICTVLSASSARFDARRFLRLAGVERE